MIQQGAAGFAAMDLLRDRLIRNGRSFDIGGEKSLIGEGSEHGDDGHTDERSDAIKLSELREIVKEEFQNRDAEQREAAVLLKRQKRRRVKANSAHAME